MKEIELEKANEVYEKIVEEDSKNNHKQYEKAVKIESERETNHHDQIEEEG